MLICFSFGDKSFFLLDSDDYFSNKKIAQMEFEKKLVYMIETVKKSKSVKKVYMLTGSPVLELSNHFVEDYTLIVKKISSPFFSTFRYVAEVIL